jgi:hypothetical protein
VEGTQVGWCSRHRQGKGEDKKRRCIQKLSLKLLFIEEHKGCSSHVLLFMRRI